MPNETPPPDLVFWGWVNDYLKGRYSSPTYRQASWTDVLKAAGQHAANRCGSEIARAICADIRLTGGDPTSFDNVLSLNNKPLALWEREVIATGAELEIDYIEWRNKMTNPP